MRLIYKNKCDGFWMSKNGHKAYLKGERPAFMWSVMLGISEWDVENAFIPTSVHHVAVRRDATFGWLADTTARNLVMFYVRPPHHRQNIQGSLAVGTRGSTMTLEGVQQNSAAAGKDTRERSVQRPVGILGSPRSNTGVVATVVRKAPAGLSSAKPKALAGIKPGPPNEFLGRTNETES